MTGVRGEHEGRGAPVPSLRAFTIVEMIIVLVLMLGVMSIVLPVALRDTERAAYRETHEQLSAVMLAARADAQRTGRTMRVVAARAAGGERWVVRTEEVLEGAGLSAASGSRGVRLVRDGALPVGIRLASSEDEAWRLGGAEAGEGPGGVDEIDAAEPGASFDLGPSEPGAWVRIGVLLPDGQIMSGGALYACVDAGPEEVVRVGRVRVNSWTGAVTMSEVARPLTTDELGEIDVGGAGGEEEAGP